MPEDGKTSEYPTDEPVHVTPGQTPHSQDAAEGPDNEQDAESGVDPDNRISEA